MTTLCPTCGRRPSERGQIIKRDPDGRIVPCPDPIHDLADRAPEMAEALELPLLFHAGGRWSEEKRLRWKAIVGTDEATNKVMCDHIRAALAAARGEVTP